MEILLEDRILKINVEKLVSEIVFRLIKDLENTPGVTEEEIKYFNKENLSLFFNNVFYSIKEIIEKSEIKHTDKFTHLELTLKSALEEKNAQLDVDIKSESPPQALIEYFCFSFAIINELIKLISGTTVNLPNSKSIFAPNLKILNGFIQQLEVLLPEHRREYGENHFYFIKHHIDILYFNQSLKVITERKDLFDFSLSKYLKELKLDDDKKKEFSNWFHIGSESHTIKPITFEDSDDSPLFLAYFIKVCGGSESENSKNYLSSVNNINVWLNRNLLTVKNNEQYINFSDLKKYIGAAKRKNILLKFNSILNIKS